MPHTTDRRTFLLQQGAVVVGIAGAAAALRAQPEKPKADAGPAAPVKAGSWPGFQLQDPVLVREMVGASHRKADRVKELLSAHPALANAAIDWGFGDWETALGASSHVGNKEIATMLLAHGARLDIFAATMLGMVDVVKATLAAQPQLAATRGPHGISLLAHARAGENEDLIQFLSGFKGAGDSVTTPLTPDQAKLYVGTYAGENSTPTIIVADGKFGLTLKAEGATEQRLVRDGEHTFHPVGAPNVRIAFSVRDSLAHRVEVAESEWLVSASRGK